MAEEKRIKLPPYSKWSPKFKKTFFERLGAFNSIKDERDMEFVKEIVLVVRDGMYLLEITRYQDIVEVLKKDLPIRIRQQVK